MLSGKFVLRLDPELHRLLKAEAERRGESLNTLCVSKIKGVGPAEAPPFLDLILRRFKPVAVIQFGSSVRGQHTAASDIDLLIVLPADRPISRQLYADWDEVVGRTADQVSPQFTHLPAKGRPIGSLWLEVAIEGEILYSRGPEVKEALRRIRSSIARGDYTRKSSHGQSYWVRRESDAE